jgi:thiosulfate dehydrogenase
MVFKFLLGTVVFALGAIIGLQHDAIRGQNTASDTTKSELSYGVLIPAHATMETAWDIPKDPYRDSLPHDPHLAEQIKYGYDIFTRTPEVAPHVSGNHVACGNCHLNAGQKAQSLPLVGIASQFPEYAKRSGRLFSLEDRIVGCFLRSQNATRFDSIRTSRTAGESSTTVTTTTKEVLAVSAYLTWLSEGYAVSSKLPWRGKNTIAAEHLLPIHQLDTARGRALFAEHCASCHGDDGQGKEIGDKRPGPLWGPQSWNDGAGAARIYTLAGIIRYAMPYLNPGVLTDEEAQHISAFINSQSRPAYPYKSADYPSEQIPIDAVYYRKR